MRVFLDANVLFSAAAHDGAARELCRRLHVAGHELVADAFVIEEARRNLAAKVGGATAWEAIRALLAETPAATADQRLPPEASGLAEKDRPVLVAAIVHRCDYLVTGDRTHFGFLFGRRVGGVRVASLRQLAEALLR
ncbi:MAG: PIN domain-containing protein [Vicinamibacteria bacterium]|nr:PIN domain-containing protein [Vicinamibacteria bacterium]